MQKTNGEHIVDLAAMKFFNNPDWDIELAAMLPTGFKEVLINEINKRFMDLSVTVSGNVARNMDKKMEKMREALKEIKVYVEFSDKDCIPNFPFNLLNEVLTDTQG